MSIKAAFVAILGALAWVASLAAVIYRGRAKDAAQVVKTVKREKAISDAIHDSNSDDDWRKRLSERK